MTEKLLQEAKEDFEKKLTEVCRYIEGREQEGGYLERPDISWLVRVFEEAIRDTMAVNAVAPHSFPAALIHDNDYYGLDNEDLRKKVMTYDESGWDGDC